MRTDPAAFGELNSASVKEPRFVVRVNFATPISITSHAGISGLTGAVIEGALMEPSIVSQRLNPIEGRSEIGSASFQVADLGGALTDEIRARLGSAAGLRDKQVEFFLGYAGLAFGDFVQVGTQRVTEASFDKGRYSVQCADIQRSAKRDIFELAETTLAQSISATDTTIAVSSTAGFSTVYHGPTYTDAAGATVGYFKLRDEVVRYTGKTSTTFTGCTRGVLGTIAAAYDVDAATPAARREKVTEHVYLELPAVKLAYAILTGQLYGDGATLPASWHLGISSALIRLSDYTGIGGDLWDAANGGVVIRFEGLKKTDGKKFLEEEVCRLVGLFMPVYADGAWGLRRASRVLSDAATVATLDESNSTQLGELVHDMGELHNVFRIFWNWNGSDYTRTTALIDASSATAHGKADPLDLKFKGLYGGRATDSLIFQLVDALRDRYAAPPERISVSVLHSLNRLEVGDVVRARFASVRDYAGAGASIDRAFEIQNVSVNHKTGQVQLELFGSTAAASALSPTTATTALPGAFYTAAGTALSTVVPITAGVAALGTYTLAGGADLTAAGSIWYHDGDLTIPQGCTLNISGNLQLRVRGYLTVNGTINGVGGGLAGVADNASPTVQLAGNPGWVGNSRGLDGIDAAQDYANGNARLQTVPVPVTAGKHAAFPYLELAVDGNTLKGLPTDLRGTGGGPGGKITSGGKATLRANGGAGAAGGAGLCTISRGFSTGVSASINLSGLSPSAPSLHGPLPNMYYPGAGGAGGPGAFLLLLDGSTVSAPDITGRFVANTGTVPQPAPYLGKLTFLDNEPYHRYSDNEDPWAGYPDSAVISGRSLAGSAQRIQFIPAPETAAADVVQAPPSVSGLAASSQDGFVLVSWTLPADPASYDAIELYASTSNDRAAAVKVFDGRASDFKHVTGDTSARFYWARSRRERAVSAWHPATTTTAATAAARPATVSGYLTNEAVALAADSAGTVASFAGASGAFKVLAGAVDVTTSATFALVGSSALTATINATTGAYSATAMAADVGTATFRATYAGVTVDKVFTVTKARAGANGANGSNGTNGSNGSNGASAVALSLSRAAVQLFAYADGSVPSFADAEGAVTVRDGATDVTASATLSATPGAGVTGTVNTAAGSPVAGQAKGFYRVTAMSGDTGTLTISAVYGGVTYQATFALAKNKTGYEIVTALPSTNLFAGRMVYLTGDGKLYRNTAGTFGSWTSVVPSSDISGQLTDAQLAAIAAAKVTGQLADSQIAAVAAAKVTGQLVASQLNIGVGGGNLLYNAAFRNHAGGFPVGFGTYNNGGISFTPSVNAGGLFGSNFYRVTANATVNNTLGFYTANDIASGSGVNSWTPGVSYVISFWARANGAGAVGRTMSGLYSNMGFSPAVALSNPPLVNGVWQRYAWRVQPADNAFTPAGTLYVSWEVAGNGFSTMPSGASFDVCALQVEQGELPSGFAPKPEEILPGVITATEIADNAITTPKLVAGSVVAGKIAAAAIGATEIQAGAVVADKIAASAVTAGKIAAAAVSAAEIAAGAVVADKIAASAVTAGKIAAASISAAEIAAGAVVADKIASNAVTTGKLLVTGVGASIIDDPNTQDITAWYRESGSIVIVNDTSSPTGKALEVPTVGQTTYSDRMVPIDATKNYLATIWARQVSGSPGSYFLISFYDAAGNHLNGGAPGTSGWYSAGSFHYWGRAGELIPSAWTEYRYAFGPGETPKIPTGAAFLRIGVLANYSGAGVSRFTRISVVEKTGADLIVDGSIIAAKLAADSVTANKIQAGAVTAAKLSVSSLDAISANVGTLTAGTIRNTADTFRVDVSNGRTITQIGSYMKVSGAPFGSASQFIEWYGPYFSSLASCTEANASYYLRLDGSSYFGGVTESPKLIRTYRSNTAASFTETAPLGVTKCVIELYGAGGGGGAGTGGWSDSGGSGGSGGYCRTTVNVTAGSTTFSGTLATEAYGGSEGGNGVDGGSSSITSAAISTMTAPGGGGGRGTTNASAAGAAGATASGGTDSNLAGIAGTSGYGATNPIQGASGRAGFTEIGGKGGTGRSNNSNFGPGISGGAIAVFRYF
jgi:hypothetical protein